MLTAPTDALQTFYLEHADDEDFFDLDDDKLQKGVKKKTEEGDEIYVPWPIY